MGIEIIPSPRPDDVPKPLAPGIRRMTMGEMMVWAAAAAQPGATLDEAARMVCAVRGEPFTAEHSLAFRKQVREG